MYTVITIKQACVLCVLQLVSEQLKSSPAGVAAEALPSSLHPLHTRERERGGSVLELCAKTQQTA